MSRSESEIRELDLAYGAAEDRNTKLSRCPTCECLLIASKGHNIYQFPTCPNCGYEKKPEE